MTKSTDSNFALFQTPNKNGYGYCPINAMPLTFKFKTIDLEPEDAYRKAKEIIMEDPRHRICDIALCDGDWYSLQCWKATERHPMKFEAVSGGHVLFYSETLFKWKGQIPGKV